MAIDTTNKKLALLELEDYWEPALPVSPGALGQDDLQQLLWGYPGILWAGATPVTPSLDRIYVVPFQVRAYVVPLSLRTTTPSAQVRVYVVPAI